MAVWYYSRRLPEIGDNATPLCEACAAVRPGWHVVAAPLDWQTVACQDCGVFADPPHPSQDTIPLDDSGRRSRAIRRGLDRDFAATVKLINSAIQAKSA